MPPLPVTASPSGWLPACWPPVAGAATSPPRPPDGSSNTGPYRAELVTIAATPVMTLPGGVVNGSMIPHAPASLDNTLPGYSLTRRLNETDLRTLEPPADWKFANCVATANPFPGTPDPARVCLKGGFDPTYLYGLVYVAKDPKVMGVGLAALRDTVSFFRRQAADSADSAGTANPLAGRMTHAIGQGTSQSGNAMKTFMHLGFNQALDGKPVFDGLFAHVAAGVIDLANLTGAYIPFHKIRAERGAAGDTDASLEERYGSQAGHVAAVTAAAQDLVASACCCRAMRRPSSIGPPSRRCCHEVPARLTAHPASVPASRPTVRKASMKRASPGWPWLSRRQWAKRRSTENRWPGARLMFCDRANWCRRSASVPTGSSTHRK